jgi:bifunctional non-homologous end joining protein LigD
LKINGRSIDISNRTRIMFPGIGLSKEELIDYYIRISEVMLPHIQGRPASFERYPNGIGEKGFYQQAVSDYFPKWIRRITVDKKSGGTITHLSCDNKETLVYLANQACITLHVWLSRMPGIDKPDKIIFDLDPSEDDPSLIVKAAKVLKKILEDEGLPSYVMLTGSSGMHVVVPIRPESGFDKIRSFAKELSERAVEEDPDEITTEQRKSKRKGRIFMDYLRNSYGQTSVAPYSVRSLDNSPIAAPLEWSEISYKNFDPQKYTVKNIFRRLGQIKDPWQNFYDHAVSIDL